MKRRTFLAITSSMVLAVSLVLTPAHARETDFTSCEWIKSKRSELISATEAITGAKAASEEAVKTLEEIDARVEEKEKQVEQLRSDLNSAKTSLDAAEAAKADAAEKRDAAQSAHDEALQAVTDAGDAIEQDQAAVNSAKDGVSNAAKNVEDARAIAEAASANLEAVIESTSAAAEQAAKGSVGFFEEGGSTEAAYYLTDSEAIEGTTGSPYASFIHIDSDVDAAALANMREALDWIEYCNSTYRTPNGLTELRITDELMASAQRNADFSTNHYQHASDMGAGFAENLNYTGLGKEAAFKGWYDDEKAVWDALVLEDPSLEQYESDAYGLMEKDYETYMKVGHYLNIIDPSWSVTGIGLNSTDNSGAAIQQFAQSDGSVASYTVEEYRDRFENYYEEYVTNGAKAVEDAQAEKDSADAALEEALLKQTEADAALRAAEEKLEASESALAAAQENETLKKEELELAENALVTAEEDCSIASNEYDNASTALETGEEELDNLNQEKAEAQANADAAEAEVTRTEDQADAIAQELSNATDLANDGAVSVSVEEATYDGTEQSPAPVVSVTMPDNSELVLVEGVDYEVEYVNNQNAGTAQVIISGRGTSDDGTWWGSTTESFAIAPKLIDDASVVLAAISDVTYAGKEIEPSIELRDGDRLLVKNSDYSLSYSDNINTGTATVKIVGMGNYGGSRTAEFQIRRADLSKATIKPIPSQVYTGKEIRPQVSVLLDGVELPVGDYSVAYENNVNPTSGAARAIVTGRGNCAGTLSAAFSIQRQSGRWMKSGSRWWYQWADKTYPYSQLLTIGKATYLFDENGWMVVGWRKLEGTWYYFTNSGAMATGWQKINGTWYVFDKNGKMITGWWKDGSTTYYLNSSGAMATGWKNIEGNWYWFRPSGAMGVGWLKAGNAWYWLDRSTGKMITGWVRFSGTYYYMKPSGAMATGWQKIGSKWFYFESSGAMAKAKWIDTWYYVGSGGAMVENGIADGYRIVNGKWDGRGKVA